MNNILKLLVILSLPLLLNACGGGGGSGDTAGAIIGGTIGGNSSGGNNSSNASVSMTASKTSVVKGDSVTISWSSSNASSCKASGYWSGSKSLSGSENLRKCFGDDHLNSLEEIKGDAFIQSHTTPREVKQARMEKLLGTAAKDFSKDNRRGYQHVTGYGTFSGYNGLRNLNAACALNR